MTARRSAGTWTLFEDGVSPLRTTDQQAAATRLGRLLLVSGRRHPGVCFNRCRRSGVRVYISAVVGQLASEVEAERKLAQEMLRVVDRLVEVKAAYEVPAPMHLCGSWFAVPTADQAAVLDAFELAASRRVTMRLGGSAWNHDHHNWSSAAHRRRYATPALDGWTLVFGRSPAVAHADRDQSNDALSRCASFGAAHWCGGDA